MNNPQDTVTGNKRSSVVQLRNVSFTWPRQQHPVISIEQFDLNQGETVFLRGPSGSGKTTLLGLIAAVLIARSGSITVNGTDLSTLKRGDKDRFRADNIGLVFQQFNLLPFLSVLDNVQLPCRFSKQRRSRALESAASLPQESARLLAAMNLPVESIVDRSVVELSVGQQQRVAVARALIGRPDLIIADEPTSSLDSDSRQAFLTLLFNEVKSAGATLLFVSHDASLAADFDRQLDLREINSASQLPATERA